MRQRTIISLFFVVPAFISPGLCQDQGSKAKPTPLPEIRAILNLSQWHDAVWTADIRPFTRMRLEIERSLSFDMPPAERQTAAQKFLVADEDNLDDSLLRFADFYVRYRLWQMSERLSNKQPVALRNQMELSNYARQTNSNAEWARLRFLITSSLESAPELIGIGERLDKRFANDLVIKYRLAKQLLNTEVGRSSQANTRALGLVHQLQRLSKKPQQFLSLEGAIHYLIWWNSNKNSDAQKAIAAYKKFLEQSDPNDPFRLRATEIIAEMQATLPPAKPLRK